MNIVMKYGGKVVIDGNEKKVQSGDVVSIERGARHTISADTDLTLIEVQIGNEISAQDKTKYSYRI